MKKTLFSIAILTAVATLSIAQQCFLNTATIAPLECNDDNSYNVSLEMTPDSLPINVHINGALFSPFSYANMPLAIDSIPWSGMGQDTFSVSYINDPDSCTVEILVNNPCFCGFNNFSFDIVDCDETLNTYFVDLDFEFYNNSDSFNLITNQGLNNSYAYSELPIELGPFSTAAAGLSITVIDQVDLSCFSIQELDPVNCAVVNACVISNVIADPQICGIDGNFYVDIEFDVVNGSSDGFLIQGNGTAYGDFEYGSAFYTIGPLAGDCSTIYEFVVIDMDDANCSDFYVLEDSICCTIVPCELSDLDFTPVCDGGELVAFNLDFNYSGNTAPTFSVFIDQQLVGSFSYGDLPISQTLNGVLITDLIIDLVITDDNDPNCEIEIFGLELFCLSECVISNVFAEAAPCDGDFYSVDLSFDVVNAVGNTFSVVGNGTNYGSFDYSQNPITLGPFESDCISILEFVVMDDVDNTCQADFEFTEAICCGDCVLADVIVDLIGCTDSLVSFTLNFNHDNTGGVGFDLYSRNGFFGFYPYSSLPFSIMDFPNTGGAMEFIRICDNDDSDCCIDFEFLLENCSNDECVLSEVAIDLLACDSFELSFILDFDFAFNTSSVFDLFSRNGYFGSFNFSDLPLTVNGFPNTGTSDEYLNICANDDPDCCIDFEFSLEECDDECELDELNIEFVKCTQDSIWFTLHFSATNTGQNGYNVEINNNSLGNFNYNAIPITVATVVNTVDDRYDFLIEDDDIEDCSIEGLQFLEQECSSSINQIESNQVQGYYNGVDIIVASEGVIDELTLYSYSGQSLNTVNDQSSISGAGLLPGIYLLKVSENKRVNLIKIAIQ